MTRRNQVDITEAWYSIRSQFTKTVMKLLKLSLKWIKGGMMTMLSAIEKVEKSTGW
jgi:hypothetical protein